MDEEAGAKVESKGLNWLLEHQLSHLCCTDTRAQNTTGNLLIFSEGGHKLNFHFLNINNGQTEENYYELPLPKA